MIDFIKRRHLPLSYKNEHKLSIKSNLVYTILIKVILPPLILFVVTCFIASNIILYMDPNYNFSMFSIIFFNIISIFFLWQFFGLKFIAITHCTFTVLYIRYKFHEINDKFLLCLRFKNFSHLQIIAQHNHICQLIQDINQLYKWYIESTVDIVTLDLREIGFRRQIFGAPAVPMGDIMLSPFEITEFDIREFSILGTKSCGHCLINDI